MADFQFDGPVTDHPNFVQTNEAWHAIAHDELPLDDLADDVVVDNGPGAGPWRHVEGKEAFFTFVMNFVPFFQGTWHQDGRCIYADDEVSIALVHETGTSPSGDVFDNRAVWVSRFDSEGKITRIWTTDVDHEAIETFWQRNPFPTDE
jgi:ketosteroid isomerase-like protein